MEQYNVKLISESDLKLISYLYKSCFNVEVSETFLKRKYDTLKLGKYTIGFLALDENSEPAAYYGVFPIRIQVNNKDIFLAAQSGDTMTDKLHQSKGLFIKLAKETYGLAEKEGIKFVFGFPNQNSLPGFQRKLEWHFYGNLIKFKKNILTIPLIPILKKLKWQSFFIQSFYSRTISKREYFQNSLLDSGQSGVFRDKDYWDYKQYGNNFTFKCGSILVWAKFDGSLLVGDIEYKADTDYSKVLKQIHRKAFFWGCSSVVFQISPNTWLNNILEANGYLSSDSLPIGYLQFDAQIDYSNIKYTYADSDTF
jgi:Acetyltransferase (GNAT) domain